jgi:hypothetical protein
MSPLVQKLQRRSALLQYTSAPWSRIQPATQAARLQGCEVQRAARRQGEGCRSRWLQRRRPPPRPRFMRREARRTKVLLAPYKVGFKGK